MLGTLDAWLTSHFSQPTSKPANYIVDCWICRYIRALIVVHSFCPLFSTCFCPSYLLPLLNSISKWDWTHVKLSLQIFSASHSWSQFQFLLCNSDFFFWSLKPVHTKNSEKWKNSVWIAETGPIWFSLSTFQA